MATRYPLIVNPSANQLQEIPFGDTLDLRGNDVNQLVVTGVSTLGIVSAGNIFSTGIVTASTLNVGTGGTIVTTTSGGLVGIRTTVPLQPLQVGSGSSVIVIDSLGELGIGTTNPSVKLQVIGDANISGVATINSIQISAGIITAASGIATYYGDGRNLIGLPREIGLACSDETSNLGVGTAKVTFRMPYSMTLTNVRLNVNTAPTGSALIVNIKENGASIFSTKPQIDVGSLTSVGSATPAVISDSALADDAEITVDVDQIGSTIAGKGLKVWLIGRRA